MQGKRVWGEPLIQHLTLDESEYFNADWDHSARRVMSPPFRNKQHQESLWNGLASKFDRNEPAQRSYNNRNQTGGRLDPANPPATLVASCRANGAGRASSHRLEEGVHAVDFVVDVLLLCDPCARLGSGIDRSLEICR
jgi:hypothetical protein